MMETPNNDKDLETLAGAQDPASLGAQEFEEWSPEISPQLAGMTAANDGQFAQAAANQAIAPTEAAADLARDLGEMIATTVESFTGRDYGLNRNAIDKWAQGVAPLMVKYGLTDMSVVAGKYGPEMQAAIASFALGAGVYSAHHRYEAEEAEQAEKEKAEKEAA